MRCPGPLKRTGGNVMRDSYVFGPLCAPEGRRAASPS